MSAVKITDLVDQAAIDDIIRLNKELQALYDTYVTVARELIKGLQIKVEGYDDLVRMETELAKTNEKARTLMEQTNRLRTERAEIIGRTTNVVARNLMEQERLNKAFREEYKDGEKVKEMIHDTVDSYTKQTERLARLKMQIDANKKSQADLEKQYKLNKISEEQYIERQGRLLAVGRDLAVQKSQLDQLMKAEEKLNNANATSYNSYSQQLQILKKTYHEMSDTMKASPIGREMEKSIQDLDSHLKDLDADAGDFHRNVGNYAIACQGGVVTTESLTAALQQEARTQQDLADQTKILEEAKSMLNKNDENYQQTLETINAKLEENKKKLTDVSDILGKEATSVAEAEAQNKRLAEAIKHIDLTSEGAKEKIEEMNAQIDHNKKIIGDATGANEKYAEQVLSIIGINANFGQSFEGLSKGGSLIDGLNVKVKAFGKTLWGLMSNPVVLALIGVTGVVAGVKWWYDYNKGLIEASRLTENFTGKSGEAADKVTADMQTLADHMGKGYSETIGAANTLVQQFGMSWEEAGALMQDGIQAGADMSGNMLANIERFAPAMRDAGVSADEFMSILAETRNGIFNEDGIQNIVKAGTRLRAMTKQTEESLDAVGISARQMQSDLESGNIKMIDAVQMVASKLKELPENSQEAGEIMKNVFGRTAAEGGAKLIQSIADVNTNLDKAKENMGELGEVNAKQMNAQRKLNEALMSIFKSSGTSFEVMTTEAKTFVIEGITKIISGCVSVVNWFIELYNKADAVRYILGGIVGVFKTMWAISKAFFEFTIEGFKGTGEIVEGIMLFISGKFEEGTKKITTAVSSSFGKIKDIAIKTGREIGAGFADEFNKASRSRINPVSLELKGDDTGNVPSVVKNGGDKNGDDDKTGGGASSSAAKDLQEQLKIIAQLEEAKIHAMSEGHEKEIALIRLNYKKRLDTITGESENEKALRLAIVNQMEDEIAASNIAYYENIARTNLENKLAIVRKGSKEELDVRLAQLHSQKETEIGEAEKTGADVLLIVDKYERQRQDLLEEYAANAAHAIQQQKSEEREIRDAAFVMEMASLENEYAEKLKLANGNQKKMEQAEEEYNRRRAEKERHYAEESARAAVDALEEILRAENLAAEERLAIERELIKAKAALEKQSAENARVALEDTINYEEDADGRRLENAERWLNVASDALNKFNDLAAAIFEAQISRIEAEQEALDAASERDIERISSLVEKKVITEEEGEARKRAAEAQSAKKHEELEKKKQQLEIKQAKWDKANAIAQAGIATALAIMQVHATTPPPLSWVMAALVGALGAVQIATILATPLPAYAKGTDYHGGGPAIVGDGGKHEIVLFKGAAWLTPDKPTLVDIPRGAAVLPDAASIDPICNLSFLSNLSAPGPEPVVINDYSELKIEVSGLKAEFRRGISEVSGLIRQQMKMQRKIASDQEYELFKSRM